MSQEQDSVDYTQDSPEAGATDAPVAKKDLTQDDRELPEDQLAFQTDSS